MSEHANGCGPLGGVRVHYEVNRIRFDGEEMRALPRHVSILIICETRNCVYVFAVFRRVRIIVEGDY